MPAYTFDMKLDASVTVEAATGDQALAMLRQAMECADCNGGAWPNGDPILFEASMNQRPEIGMIDGEDARIVTLHDWADLRAREAASAVDWEAVARREGWVAVNDHGKRYLSHRNLDRIWPADDWEGAARDLGIGDDGRYPDESDAA